MHRKDIAQTNENDPTSDIFLAESFLLSSGVAARINSQWSVCRQRVPFVNMIPLEKLISLLFKTESIKEPGKTRKHKSKKHFQPISLFLPQK